MDFSEQLEAACYERVTVSPMATEAVAETFNDESTNYGGGTKSCAVRTVNEKDHADRKLANERWQDFRNKYRDFEFNRLTYVNAAKWMVENFDDMDFLTAKLGDATDFVAIGKRIKDMIEAYKKTPKPKRAS